MSLDTKSSSAVENARRPVHVLMAGLGERIDVRNPALEHDYLARRYNCFRKAKKAKKIDPATDGEDEALWSGATPLEKALVACCEMDGGVLARGKELIFLGLVARHCHTVASQALTLAILQRTIDGTHEEEESSDEESEYYESSSEEESERKGPMEKTRTAEKATDNGSNSGNVSSNDDDEEDLDRISPFLVAGGLQILSDWLVDSSTPVMERPRRSQSPPLKKDPSLPPPTVEARRRNPLTGPMLIPLLFLLERIPFHKKLVTETKINKNIRNLKKQLDEAVESFHDTPKCDRNGEKIKLEEWRDPVAGGNAVVQVQAAIQSLMESWQSKAKEVSGQPAPEDPFKSLKDLMQERLDVLVQYETDLFSEKPEWLIRMQEMEETRMKKKRGKMTTKQLARLERRKEGERIQKTRREAQQAKEKLEELRRKRNAMDLKRKAEEQVNEERMRRKVQWKDGLSDSDSVRHKHILEVVHEYPAEHSEQPAETNENEENAENERGGSQYSMDFEMEGVPLADDSIEEEGEDSAEEDFDLF